MSEYTCLCHRYPCVLGGSPAVWRHAPDLVTVHLLPLHLAAAVHLGPHHPGVRGAQHGRAELPRARVTQVLDKMRHWELWGVSADQITLTAAILILTKAVTMKRGYHGQLGTLLTSLYIWSLIIHIYVLSCVIPKCLSHFPSHTLVWIILVSASALSSRIFKEQVILVQ